MMYKRDTLFARAIHRSVHTLYFGDSCVIESSELTLRHICHCEMQYINYIQQDTPTPEAATHFVRTRHMKEIPWGCPLECTVLRPHYVLLYYYYIIALKFQGNLDVTVQLVHFDTQTCILDRYIRVRAYSTIH